MSITESLISEYASRDAVGLAEWVQDGHVAPAELVEVAIALIERLNPRLNAVVYRTYDLAREAAQAPRRDAPFFGVPFLLKDMFTAWRDLPVTQSCRYLRNVRSPGDSDLARRIKQAGFVLLGKTNIPEAGWSLATEPREAGRTYNPWRDDVTASGSSGRAAAAVAARLVPLADATDAAGSIRAPASVCGLVGLKPSRGRISHAPYLGDPWYGCAYSLCHSRTVRDTAAYLDAIATGSLPGDPYHAMPPDEKWVRSMRRPPGRLNIGFATRVPGGHAFHPEVEKTMGETTRLLADLGHQVAAYDWHVFNAELAWATYLNLGAVLTAQLFESFASEVGAPVGPDDVEAITWAMIERGRRCSGVQHAEDVQSLRVIGRALVTELLPFDLYLTPTLTHPPRPHGYMDMSMTDYDAYNALMADACFLYPFNISGQPAMSLPMHWTADGLPVGVQLVARVNSEATLLRVAAQLEEARPWIGHKPPICA